MQQRYYDPVAERFMSVDPVLTDADTGRRSTVTPMRIIRRINTLIRMGEIPLSALLRGGIILYLGATKYANDPQIRRATDRVIAKMFRLV